MLASSHVQHYQSSPDLVRETFVVSYDLSIILVPRREGLKQELCISLQVIRQNVVHAYPVKKYLICGHDKGITDSCTLLQLKRFRELQSWTKLLRKFSSLT